MIFSDTELEVYKNHYDYGNICYLQGTKMSKIATYKEQFLFFSDKEFAYIIESVYLCAINLVLWIHCEEYINVLLTRQKVFDFVICTTIFVGQTD
jgi:hypothetical protein